jgi:site-specific recombinase XerD
MRGVDIRTVGKILGHKTLQVTLRYAHLSPDHLKGAVGKLDYQKQTKHAKEA